MTARRVRHAVRRVRTGSIRLLDTGVFFKFFVGVHDQILPFVHDKLELVNVQTVEDGLHDHVTGC